jgi:hypothetical protein
MNAHEPKEIRDAKRAASGKIGPLVNFAIFVHAKAAQRYHSPRFDAT